MRPQVQNPRPLAGLMTDRIVACFWLLLVLSGLTSTALDGQGDLWAGTEVGVITRYHQGQFTTYTTEHGLPTTHDLESYRSRPPVGKAGWKAD